MADRDREVLTDRVWARLVPLLLTNSGRRGRPWGDHRRISNGILWKLRTGAPWRDLPARYGPWSTCSSRFARWRRDGTWDRLLVAVQGQAGAKRDVCWEVRIDSTVVRAHQHAAGARHQSSREDTVVGVEHPVGEALGRSRGGLTSKIHLACDGHGRPLAVVLTPGQRHDSTQLEPVLDAIRVPCPGRGRPRKRPDLLLADKGYSYPHCRAVLRRRGIPHVIPERRDQRARRSRRPGRPPRFERSIYARRNVVEMV